MTMRKTFWVLVLVASACGAHQTTGTTPTPPTAGGGDDAARGGTRELELDPVQIEVVEGPGGEVTTVATDARTLFDEGNDALMQRRFDDAIAAYDTLASDFPASPLVPAALYNSGVAAEGKEDWSQAAERYRRARTRFKPGTQDHIDASFRLGSVLAELGQFNESQQVFETLLESDTLSPADRIEGLARLGYALVELKDYVGAEDVLRSALAYHKEVVATSQLESNYYASMAQYYLAVIAHRQFRAWPLRYPEEQMGRDLDKKSELFLLAQDRYWKVIDDYPNPWWTTASVYQMGQMFKEFWDDFMAVPLPEGMSEAGAKEYVKLLNQNPQLRKLLEKALYFHETNVVRSKENGIDTVWVHASDERAAEVRDIMARQQKGELFAPGKVPGRADPVGDEGEAPLLGEGSGDAAGPRDYVPGRTDL
jgi:tetratricopeptide (TPR) repeat protein